MSCTLPASMVKFKLISILQLYEKTFYCHTIIIEPLIPIFLIAIYVLSFYYPSYHCL